jgi:hypothetical protein
MFQNLGGCRSHEKIPAPHDVPMSHDDSIVKALLGQIQDILGHTCLFALGNCFDMVFRHTLAAHQLLVVVQNALG